MKYQIKFLIFDLSTEKTTGVQCNDNEFRCSSGYGCLDNSLVCDGLRQCYDNSDELGCGK